MRPLEFWMQFIKIGIMMAAFLMGINLYFKMLDVLEMIKLFIFSQ